MIRNYKETAAKFICAAFVVASVYLFFRYLFPPLLPFILALGLASLADIPSAKLASKTKIKANVYRILFSVILVLFIFVLIYLLINKLVYECTGLTAKLSDGGLERIFEAVDEKLNALGNKFPLIASINEESTGARARLMQLIEETTAGITSSVGKQASLMAGKMIVSLPGIILFIVIFIVALLFLAKDLDGLKNKISEAIPEKWRAKLSDFRDNVLKSVVGYIKSYALIMLVMFALLFIGFTLIRSKYALTLAVITAFLDMLPILGVGIVLLPWALAAFFQGNIATGVALIAVYASCIITRQIIEPKIVGKNIGLPPVVTLICMYAGLKLYGAAGLILLPFFAAIIFPVFKRKEGIDKDKK